MIPKIVNIFSVLLVKAKAKYCSINESGIANNTTNGCTNYQYNETIAAKPR
jgi:hypothetical protein